MVENKTDLFLQKAFPSVDRIMYSPDVLYETNDIMLQIMLQYGHGGSGKTGTSKSIVEQAVKIYGEDNVNASISPNGNLRHMMSKGLNDKLVQILILDDITLTEIPTYVLQDFFRIRHIWKDRSNVDNGYILVMFNCHRYHGIDVNLRTNIDIILWKSPPTSPYDQTVMKKYVGDEGLEVLQEIEEYRLEDPKWNSVGVFNTRTDTGILELDLPENDYTRNILNIPIRYGDY